MQSLYGSRMNGISVNQRDRSLVGGTKGWTRGYNAACLHIQDDGSYEFIGKIVRESPNGNMRRIIFLECAGTNIVLHLDAERFHGTSVWMTIKHARKLIAPGVWLSVSAALCDDDGGTGVTTKSSQKIEIVLNATRIVVESALPSSPYLARLFSFSNQELQLLFPGNVVGSVSSRLLSAVEPCDIARCEDLCKICRLQKREGNAATLFRRQELMSLCEDMRIHNCWTRSRYNAPGPTKRFAWESLHRMEQLWCCERDGSIEEHGVYMEEGHKFDSTGHSKNGQEMKYAERLVFHGIDVDPSLNIPDLSDKRRLQYSEQRKRPQVQWMLEKILALVGSDREGRIQGESTRKIHLVDIGGGRGDLSMAVAAFFCNSKSHNIIDAHVTVLDVNESSLRSGEERARSAGLDSKISFVHCDISQNSQVDEFLKSDTYGLFYGLHCCGGLAEAAVEIALRAQTSFCISTCCFRSNQILACLTRRADFMFRSDANQKSLEKFRDDIRRVSVLSTGASSGGQHRAIRALNAMRRAAAEDLMASRNQVGKSLTVSQESFPVQFSVQNRVLIGRMKSNGSTKEGL